jgi:hypothetical protein
MWAPYGLGVSHHQSHFASLVRTISFLILTSTDESAGGAILRFDSSPVNWSGCVLHADDSVQALQVAYRIEGLANASSSKQVRGDD